MKRNVAVLAAVAIVASAAYSIAAVGAAGEPAGTSPAFTSLKSCIETKRALDLEMVIDTSSSLRKSDPLIDGTTQRVVAANVVVESLRRLVTRVPNTDVRVKVSGFSDGYQQGTWFQVANGGIDGEIDSFNRRTDGNTTRFGEGLSGAQRSTSASAATRCPVVLFFTDGALDVDNNGRDDGNEEAARAAICAPDGSVASMRRNGTKLIAVSLLKNAAAAPATEAYLARMANGACGTPADPSAGFALSVASAEDLVEVFNDIGVSLDGEPVIDVSECPADIDVPASVNAFHVFARAGQWKVVEVRRSLVDFVQVPAPDVGGEERRSGNGYEVLIKRPTQGTALIDVTGITPLSSAWRVGFDDNADGRASCRAYLFEDWRPEFDPAPKSLKRGEGVLVSARIVNTDGEAVDAEFDNLKAWEPSLEYTITSPVDGPVGTSTSFTVPATRRGDHYAAEVTVPDEWSTHLVTIQGRFVVSETATGSMEVSAPTPSIDRKVIVPGGHPKPFGPLKIELSKVSGTGTARAVQRFKGAPTNGGEVSLRSVTVNDAPAAPTTYGDPRAPQARRAVSVRANEIVEIPVEVSVTKSADGSVSGYAQFESTTLRPGADGPTTVPYSVPFTFVTARKVCSVCRLGLTAVLLVLALLIPLALLWLLNLRGAKFEPPSELRAAAIPFAIEASGKARRDDGRVDDLPPDRYTYIDTPHDQQVRAFQVAPPGSAMPWEFVAKTSLNPFKPPSGLMRSHTIGAIGRSGMDGSLPPHGVVPLALRGAWVFRLDSIEELDAPADVAGEVAEEQPIALKGELLVFVSSEVPERDQLPKILTDAYAVLPDLGRALGASILEQRRAVAARTEAQTGPVPEASDDGPSGPHLLPPSDGPSYSSTMQPPADGGGSNPSWMTGPGPFDGDDPSGRLMPPP